MQKFLTWHFRVHCLRECGLTHLVAIPPFEIPFDAMLFC